jgi:DNA-binding NarL/FixJ family response regulator
MAEQVRVIILEDDFFARDAMAQRLQRDDRVRVVGEAREPCQTMRLLADINLSPNLLLVDLDFPNQSEVVFEMVAAARQSYPALRIMCLTLHPQPDLIQRVLGLGVDGLVQKNECADGLGLGVERCMMGEFVITPSVTIAMANTNLHRSCFVLPWVALPEAMANHLQKAAYLRYVRGLTRDQIAEELVLTHFTVDSYLKQIKAILHIATRSNLLTRGFMAITRLLWEEYRYTD